MADELRRGRPAGASAPLDKQVVDRARTALALLSARSRPSLSRLVGRLDFPLRAPTVPLGVEPPPSTRKVGGDYETEWARRPAARAARAALLEGVTRPAMRAVADPEVRGLDRLLHVDGPVIFAANHHSHLDTAILLSALPSRFRHKAFVVAAADYFFANRATSAASALALNAIPFERVKIGRRSADQAAELLGDGWNMVIFPEGGRSPDGWGQEFKPGAAYLAQRCDVAVVPVHLLGVDRLLPKGATRLKRGQTVVTFGAPLELADGEDSRRFSVRIEAAVAALGDEARTDWWTARRRAHDSSTPAMAGPATSSWRRAWELGDRTPLGRPADRAPSRTWPDLD
ncbi:MAG TPA: lysophospholipid acyltransferase family protein [Acidimicrobiales bacterium]|jgi:1-acyl-sn-glycerol-3-phosphate acyltransferase|nr:lysophospholipid acyltransferase family protein [Acidimicrobiales bacterium]